MTEKKQAGKGEQPEEETEQQKVEQWRKQHLLFAGYTEDQAALLSVLDVDWHQAVKMVESQGCDPSLAVKILA